MKIIKKMCVIFSMLLIVSTTLINPTHAFFEMKKYPNNIWGWEKQFSSKKIVVYDASTNEWVEIPNTQISSYTEMCRW